MGNKEENIYDDQYWYEKAKKDYAEPEPRHEDQDKEYGPDVLNPQRSLIDLTGNWFVHFGADLPDYSIEGSRILTLKGNFDPDTLVDVLVENIYNDLPEKGRELLDKHNQRIVIRTFNRI